MTKEKFLKVLGVYLSKRCNKAADAMYKHLTALGRSIMHSYKLTNADKEDVVAEAVNSAFININRYDPKYSINTWFGTIVKNKATDFFRKQKSSFDVKSIEGYFVNESLESEPLQIADEFDCPVNRLTNVYLTHIIVSKIEALPVGDKKTILTQYFIEQKTNSEIISDNNSPKAFVNVTIFRFKESMKAGDNYGKAA